MNFCGLILGQTQGLLGFRAQGLMAFQAQRTQGLVGFCSPALGHLVSESSQYQGVFLSPFPPTVLGTIF
ncbi:hypothetical protein ACRRTK_013174 [Alexandromys fortis]